MKWLWLIIGMVLLGVRAWSQEWWNENWTYRVKITLKNSTSSEWKNIPVVITGEILRKKTGLLKEALASSSVRVVETSGQEIPVQVDEKDNTGLYQAVGNGQLDKDDEIVFQVNLKPGESKNFFLYYREKPAPIPEYPTDLKFERVVYGEKNCFYNSRVSNKIISVGIRGAATELGSDGKLKMGGLGKASITSFVLNGKELIYQGHSWGWNLLGTGYTTLANILPWGEPELLIDGPVRKIVVCRSPGVDKDFNQEVSPKWTLSGKVQGDYYRFFAVYAGLPLVTVSESVVIKQAEPQYSALYEAAWCPTYPRDWENDVIFLPLAGKAVTITFQDERNYQAKKVEEGWFGIANTREKRGLAMFFEPEKAADITVDFHAFHLKRDQVLASDWSKKYTHVQARLWYRFDNFNLKPVQESRFGFWGLTEEDAAGLAAIYRGVWTNAPVKEAVFGFPEEKLRK
ncbi:MAG: hypothetical protein NC911_01165 [Candidatus Omnitrophica bacterium]|nr:hypothetical protein [Candidatus Omnitrophota bacterium]